MKHEKTRPPTAVILAADIGSRLSPLIDTCANALLTVGGSIILERMIRNCLSCGISQFVLVLGYQSNEIRQFVEKTFRGIRVTYVINDRYRDTNTGYALALASSAIGTAAFIKFNGNVVFDTKVLRQLVDSDLPNILCMNRNITINDDHVKVTTNDRLRVIAFGKSVDHKAATGEAVGIEKISAVTGPLLFAELKQIVESRPHGIQAYEVAYERLIHKGMPFHALDITGLNWSRIDTAKDLIAANAMFGSPVTTVSRDQQRAADEAMETRLNRHEPTQ